MKKLLMILLAAVLALYAGGASAVPADIPPEDLRVSPGADVYQGMKRAYQGTRASSAFPETQDVISIKDGVFTITSTGVTAEIQVPFGWMGFTQDLKLQLSDYIEFFDDPRQMAEMMISNGISLCAWDSVSDAFMQVFFERNTLSELLVDLQDQDSLEAALSFYQENAWEGEELGTVVINGINFIRNLQVYEEYDTVLYFTFINGAVAAFQIYPHTAEVTPQEEEILVSLVEMASLS